MDVCVLGPLVVRDGGREIRVGGPQHRRILARLAVSAGSSVTVDGLEAALWGEEPPPTARHTIASRVFQLRSHGLAIDTTSDGYALRDPTDAATFEQLVASDDPGRPTVAAAPDTTTLRDALALWRGRPYPELDDVPDAVAEAARLTELADAARDRLLALAVDLGDLAEATAEARRLTTEQPYRERRWELLMLALYRAGRQADALAAYAECRRLLVADLGLEPGPGLRRMQQAVLSQDPGLDRPATSVPSARSEGSAGPASPAASAAPALSSAASRRSGAPRLPGTGTRLVGRDEERHELAAVWERTRLATVIGPPGSGKTRLVLDVARADRGPVWYVALEQITLDESVAAAILGVVAPASRAADASAGVREALADGDGLLLLDGCEARREEVAAEVSMILSSCADLRILATSRERLGHPDEALIPVAGLPDVEALELLVDRACLSDPGFQLARADLDDAERLCALVDRLPLAIELVARHLQVLSVREVVARVEDDLGRWAGRSAGGRPGLWAALAGSFERLTPLELRVQLALGVMAAEADLALIADVAGPDSPTTDLSECAEAPARPLDAETTFDVVARLVDASLVQVRSGGGATRYEVLQTIGRFSREFAEPAGLAAAGHRYQVAVLRNASALSAALSGPGRTDAMERLDREMAHVRALLRAIIAEPAAVPRATDGLTLAIGLTDYWLGRRPAEGVEFLELLIAAADPPPALRAEARLRQAHLAYWLTAFDRGFAAADEARRLFASLGDRGGEGRAYRRIGAIAAATDDMVAARRALEASLARLDEAGLEDESGTTLLHLGSLLADEGDVAAALPLLERARVIAERRTDPLPVGHVLAALNLARWKADDLEAALEVGELALARFRELGHRPTEGTVAYRLSAVARGLGRPAAARRYAQLAIEAGEQVQTRTTVALGHADLARLDLDAGATDLAADHLRAALDLHDPAVDRWVLVEVLEAVARLLVMTDTDGAVPLLRSAAAIRADIRQPVAPTEAADLARARAAVGLGPTAATESPDAPADAPLDAVAAHARARSLLGSIAAPPARRPDLSILRGAR